MTDPDRHVTRSGEDYAEAMLALLPQGQAWPRDSESALARVVKGLTKIWGDVEYLASLLLERESDPRKTLPSQGDPPQAGLLTDWERNWGLPDPCYEEPQSVAERQQALVRRMTIEGAQSREFFIQVAKEIGYHITIKEYRPFFVAMDGCGDCRQYGAAGAPDPIMRNQWGQPIMNARGDGPVKEGELSGWPNYGLGPLANRYYWTVYVDQASLTWFRCGASQTGIDPHLRIGLATDLECLLNRWKPAHTVIIFNYEGLSMPAENYEWFRVGEHHCGVDPHCHIWIAGTP
jgi:uncharacterized protein YmfQ (DUF2313 family)